jgi:hypothetical protein
MFPGLGLKASQADEKATKPLSDITLFASAILYHFKLDNCFFTYRPKNPLTYKLVLLILSTLLSAV